MGPVSEVGLKARANMPYSPYGVHSILAGRHYAVTSTECRRDSGMAEDKRRGQDALTRQQPHHCEGQRRLRRAGPADAIDGCYSHQRHHPDGIANGRVSTPC